jgi:hypothetical protein
MTQREVAFGGIGLVVACAIGFIADLTTSQSSWALVISAPLAVIVGFYSALRALDLGRVVKVVIPTQSSRRDGDRRITLVLKDPQKQLVGSIRSIEEKANEVLSREHGEERWSLFETRSELRSSNVWSESDVEAFDRALSIRNEIVHGDKPTGEESVSDALADTRLLLEKLDRRLYQSTAPSSR